MLTKKQEYVPPKPTFRMYEAVIPKARTSLRGRVGMVIQVWFNSHGEQTKVQFGADGPFRVFRASNLRAATREEARKQGIEGVGRLSYVSERSRS